MRATKKDPFYATLKERKKITKEEEETKWHLVLNVSKDKEMQLVKYEAGEKERKKERKKERIIKQRRFCWNFVRKRRRRIGTISFCVSSIERKERRDKKRERH